MESVGEYVGISDGVYIDGLMFFVEHFFHAWD